MVRWHADFIGPFAREYSIVWQSFVRQWLQQQARQRVYSTVAEAARGQAAGAPRPGAPDVPSPPCDVGLVFALRMEQGGLEDLLQDVVMTRGAGFVVRQGLLAALPRESAPLVQVAMIELLTSVRESDAAPLFERLSRDETADKDVREAARRALAVLRTPSPADTLKNNQPSNPLVS